MKKLLCTIFILMLSGAVFAQSDTAHFNRGVAQFNNGELQPAITSFSEAIRLNPNHAEAYARRAWAYNRSNNSDQAIADANQAIALNPNLALAYFVRGTAYVNRFNYERAIEDLTKSIELDPNNALAYNNRAIVYNTLRDIDRTIADYTQVLRLDPNNAAARRNIVEPLITRAKRHVDRNDYDSGIADVTQAIRYDPNNAEAYGVRGVAHQSKNDINRAIADYETYLRLNTNQRDPTRQSISSMLASLRNPNTSNPVPNTTPRPAQQTQPTQPAQTAQGISWDVYIAANIVDRYSGQTVRREFKYQIRTRDEVDARSQAMSQFLQEYPGANSISVIRTQRWAGN